MGVRVWFSSYICSLAIRKLVGMSTGSWEMWSPGPIAVMLVRPIVFCLCILEIIVSFASVLLVRSSLVLLVFVLAVMFVIVTGYGLMSIGKVGHCGCGQRMIPSRWRRETLNKLRFVRNNVVLFGGLAISDVLSVSLRQGLIDSDTTYNPALLLFVTVIPGLYLLFSKFGMPVG